MVIDYCEIMWGEDYNTFWKLFFHTFPAFNLDLWYEVYIDFWEDLFNPSLPIEVNLWNAYKYLINHQNDYDS